jgi:cytidylate kinase
VPVVAIDGPGASGKGTVARMVAEALGFRYLDSGSIYRVAALAARRAGLDLDDEKAVAVLATGLDVTYRGEAVLLSGEDVTEAIRSEEVSQAASRIAALPALREALMWRQRAFLGRPGLVAEGRDMGSVVFPDATLKVYLTASAEERAARRHKQLIEKGMRASLPNLLQDLVERDARDSRRSVAPLGKAPGAVELDSTGIGAQDVCERIVGWFRERTGL